MRITVNLATRPFADLGPIIRRLRIAAGVMALASLVFGIGLYFLHHKAEEARARAHSLDGKVAAITQERQSYQDFMRRPENAQLLIQIAALNQLFDKKTFSWTLAMEDLETVLPGGVQVSTLEPMIEEKTGAITVHLRVIGPRDRTVELVQNLEHSKRFVLPRITGENAEVTGGIGERLEPVSASNRVNFDLLAEYAPATTGDLKQAAKAQKPTALATVEPKKPGARAPRAVVHKPRPGMATPAPGQPPMSGISRPRPQPLPRRPPLSRQLPIPQPTSGGPQ